MFFCSGNILELVGKLICCDGSSIGSGCFGVFICLGVFGCFGMFVGMCKLVVFGEFM